MEQDLLTVCLNTLDSKGPRTARGHNTGKTSTSALPGLDACLNGTMIAILNCRASPIMWKNEIPILVRPL